MLSWEQMMNEFEDRVRSALASGAEQAPLVDGLAASARGRLARRRRTTWVAVAAAVAVAAIPVGFAVVRGGDSSAPVPSVSSPTVSPVSDGWRWESYRDVEFQVPDSWGYGNINAWCFGNAQPVVDRPNVGPGTGCSPTTGYGAWLGSSALVDLAVPNGSVWQWTDGPDTYPVGSWLSIVLRGDVALHVVAESQATALHIAQSVRVVADVDSHGCAPVAEMDSDIVGPPVLPSLESAHDVSVCLYDVSAGPHLEELLVRSDRLSDGSGQRLLDALRSASALGQSQITCPKLVRAQAFLVHLPGGDVWLNPGHDCRPEGILDGGDIRHLTADVLYALQME
jgi:hypothetical protein